MASKFDVTTYFSAMCDGECLEGELHTSNWILMGTFPYMHVFFWFAWRLSLQKQIDYIPLLKCATSFTRLESKPVLAIALLPYLLPDTRMKADHTKIIKFVDVSSLQYVVLETSWLLLAFSCKKKSTNGNFMGGFFLCSCAGVHWSWERSKGPGSTAMPSGSRYPYQLQGCIFIMWRNNHLQSCISRYCITVASNFFLLSTCILQWVVQTSTSFWSITF